MMTILRHCNKVKELQFIQVTGNDTKNILDSSISIILITMLISNVPGVYLVIFLIMLLTDISKLFI